MYFKSITKFANPILTVFILFAVFSHSVHAMRAPDEVVKQTVDQIVNKIQQNRDLYKKDTNALYSMIDEILIPTIHVQRMSNLILGQHGRGVSDDKKALFANEFKTFLVRSYAKALLDYTGDEQVIYHPVELAQGVDKVQVKADLIATNGQSYPISLYMSNRKDDRWRAYNINVSGINFVSTYRSTFAGVIKKKGIDGLIADLKAKNAKLLSE